jgi:hypothetical protein
MILWFKRELAWRERSLRTTLVKRSIGAIFAALLTIAIAVAKPAAQAVAPITPAITPQEPVAPTATR